jgi:flagellar biosynthesis/type III secretory pathway protein FliH
MTNNKQQTAVEWYIIKKDEIEIKSPYLGISPSEYEQELIKAEQQAKEMEIAGKEMSYSDGYKEGYHRAIENAKYQINKWLDKELKITQQ